MEKRNIQIDLDTARKWYKGDDKSLKVLAKQAFTMEELEEPILPKSWEEYRSNHSYDDWYEYIVIYDKAREAFDKLITLRDVYRQGWKPNFDGETINWCLQYYENNIIVRNACSANFLFSFPTKELAEQFLENFRKELEKLKELL